MSLANLGYLGHMWELYAMWTWMAAFVAASEQVRSGGDPVASGVPALVTFAVIGSGAVGCWLGGRYADRWGRTLVTSVAMAISGSCALSVGALFARSLVLLGPLLLVWGVAVDRKSTRLNSSHSQIS